MSHIWYSIVLTPANKRPKVDPILKLNNVEAISFFSTPFRHNNRNVHAVSEHRSRILAHASYELYRSVNIICLLVSSYVSFAGIMGFQEAQVPSWSKY